MRSLGIVALGAAVSSTVAAQSPAPHPNSIAAQLSATGHHVPNSVGPDRYAPRPGKVSDDCRSDPEIDEIKFSISLINCLRAEFEPDAMGPAVTRQAASAQTKLSDLQAVGGGVGIYPCSEFTKALENPDLEAVFFTWAEGFLTGWNMGLPNDSGFRVDMSGLSRDEQKQFMRNYCKASPTKRYLEGVTALMSRLRTTKKN
jgi:hypothetical protein